MSDQLAFDLTAPAAPAPKAPRAARPADPMVMSVSELTRSVREILEAGIGEIWVEGEISNLRRQASGHQYFTLKDAGSQLSCVLFARATAALQGLELSDGGQVELFGGLTVYEARGQYQLVVRKGRARGAGQLHARFEALKRKLDAEGLFDPARKRPLPKFAARIGVVTSPTGAAIRDFLHVLHRRSPGISVVINPVRVQGIGAAAEIARAVGEFSSWGRMPPVDVIVVTRGGGSLEDLWEFNEEAVARAIAASPIPVVSAVGHEIDFTICDFVADFRAPTPSAAAEVLSADAGELILRLRREAGRMEALCRSRLQAARQRTAVAASSSLFREPARRLRELAQQTDRLWDDLASCTREASRERSDRLRAVSVKLDPRAFAAELRHSSTRVGGGLARMTTAIRHLVSSLDARTAGLGGRLGALDPAATLARGFTISLDADGRPLDSAARLHAGDRMVTKFRDGNVESVVST